MKIIEKIVDWLRHDVILTFYCDIHYGLSDLSENVDHNLVKTVTYLNSNAFEEGELSIIHHSFIYPGNYYILNIVLFLFLLWETVFIYVRILSGVHW